MESNAVKVYKDNFGEDSIVQGDINTLIDKIPEHDKIQSNVISLFD